MPITDGDVADIMGGEEAAARASEPPPRLDNTTEISRIYDIRDFPVILYQGISRSFNFMSAIKFGNFIEFKFLEVEPFVKHKRKEENVNEKLEK